MATTAPERELLKRFEVQKFLGKGSYGSVYVARARVVVPAGSRVRDVGIFGTAREVFSPCVVVRDD